MATCGLSAGAKPVYEALVEEIKELGLSEVDIVESGCIGTCSLEPLVEVYNENGEKVTFIELDEKKARDIARNYLAERNLEAVAEYLYIDEKRKLYYQKQEKVALRNCGVINPESIEEYIAVDGYQALATAISSMRKQEVINIIKDSGLKGRGGGGFPTGVKWQFASDSPGDTKYIICNADEGDPGAFMDRSILEGDPHAILEAMAIAGYAIGASQGYIYIRAEYPLAVARLRRAIKQAKNHNLLGNNILDTDFSFDIELRLGSGAFVCGEETALMSSIEGNRGMPKSRPPYPATKGLWGKPTNINNVETFANIPTIIRNGVDWFRQFGTTNSPGTKVFALGGNINNTGLVEIPLGTTVREVIFEIGGGIPDNKEFKAVQTGGPSGGCITSEHLDTPIDYNTLLELGSMMGSGGMIVIDNESCMVDIARFFLDFTVDESCGKCTPCREGTKRMLEILDKITQGNASMEDLNRLERLGNTIKKSSLCGLGQTAPNPVLSTLRYFYDEYEAHIKNKECPAGVCKALTKYFITNECIGCTKCAHVCPVDAISGEVKQLHIIDQDLCIKCGACMETCPVNAIILK
ncbi:MAG: NADH-ubiquinone oxidoreductase-F iron-sulfur binding region domain-containing protein [Clostridia bacterium]